MGQRSGGKLSSDCGVRCDGRTADVDEQAEFYECVVPNAKSLSSASTGQCPYPWALGRSDVLI